MSVLSRFSPWKWLLTLFTAASFIEVVFWSQMQAFTPLYLPKLGITDPAQITVWTGAIIAISSAIGLPFLPFWGALADRYARQPVIVRSFVAHLLAGVLCLLAGNIWVFVLGRAIQSLSLGNSGLMLTILSERVPQRRVGLAFSIMNGAAPVGAFLGPLIGGPIVDSYGFPTLLAVDTGLLLVTILGMTFGYRDDFKGTNRGSLIRMAVGSVGIIFKSARLRALFPALFLLQAGWMLAFAYVSLTVQELYKGDSVGTAIGLVQGASGVVSIVLSLLMGVLGDRFGHWRVLIIGAALSVILWLGPFFTRDIVSFGVAWAAVNGLSTGLFALLFTVLAASALRGERGRVMSFAYLPVNLGYAIGPAIGSVVAPISIFLVFPVAALITALSVGALVLASRTEIEGVSEAQTASPYG